MNKNFLAGLTAASLVVLVISGCGKDSGQISAPSASGPGSTLAAQNLAPQNDPNVLVPESSIPRPGEFHTNHLIYVGQTGQMIPLRNPSGFSPAQIRAAYGVPSIGGSGTIVIVDAYDNPNAWQDFNEFAQQYNLLPERSLNLLLSTNKVFQVVYASGHKPSYNSGWSQEEALDIEWAHAMAPYAKIVLVEANSNSFTDLFTAEDVAATLAHAEQCSNSWGGDEFSGENGYDSHFNHAGVTYLASGGDTGGVQEYPSACPNVVAVGGTSLHLDGSNHRTSETAWNGTGCGPSSFESRPTYQNGVQSVVGTHRGIADVSAVADPYTGVAVRWHGGWYVFGGTSVACPVIAGVINTSGSNRGGATAENTYIYGGLGGANFYDVTGGQAGSYHALTGYDFPTGVGSPNGTAGF